MNTEYVLFMVYTIKVVLFGVSLKIYVKLLFPLVHENMLNWLNWLLRFFMYSSYVVISVLNAFQVAIVPRNIQYLRLIVYVFGR